jgi:high-affinity K+ transport system ATPase subunit B
MRLCSTDWLRVDRGVVSFSVLLERMGITGESAPVIREVGGNRSAVIDNAPFVPCHGWNITPKMT